MGVERDTIYLAPAPCDWENRFQKGNLSDKI